MELKYKIMSWQAKWSNPVILVMSLFFILIPFSAGAVVVPRVALKSVYEKRPDLQTVFNARSWLVKKGSRAASIGNLENWARKYGWKEYPEELAAYKPEPIFVFPPPSRGGDEGRVLKLPSVTAEIFIIVDPRADTVLAAKKPDIVWPIASLTKLITAMVARAAALAPTAHFSIAQSDEVGGGRLRVPDGTLISGGDLLAAMLIGSANNAAGALARAVSGTHEDFVHAMNAWVEDAGFIATDVVDPSGIGVGNVSTAREVAQIARTVFSDELLRDLASRPQWDFKTMDGKFHRIVSTDWLLREPRYRDIRVAAGKTGYIDESKWNLVVQVTPTKKPTDRELLIVVLGSGSRRASFDDAAMLARWAWKNFEW